ncbi:MAG: hypothetical protein RQ741_03660 [Wenzhouxiangellaceae bacterium]|nr:hypothetical protein [Wenzhouxiangellaceae bacterium]
MAVAAMVQGPAFADENGGDIEAGKRLYESGMLASGEKLSGIGFGDAPVDGDYAACVRCHRKSGFGSYEGGYYIPPITQPYLFGGRDISRDDRFRALFMQAQTASFRHQVRRFRNREPYTIESLAIALRDGIDPTGRSFERLMPRYALGDTDLRNLVAYLETLSITLSEGVGPEYVELATVIHSDIDEAERRAMLATLSSFVEWYNERTRGDTQLAGHSVYGSSLYTRYSRLYRLHVWEIDGSPETWREQLLAHYERQPVFSLVSGQVPGSWRPIGDLADELGLPAIFPITELPHDVPELGGYTVYFNRGLLLESELMLDWLAGQPAGRVVQLVDSSEQSRRPAANLAALAAQRGSGLQIETVDISGAVEPRLSLKADYLIVWLDGTASKQLVDWKNQSGAATILLPSNAIDVLRQQSGAEIGDDFLFSYPFALQQEHYPERFRARAWMKTRGLEFDASRIQFQSYYAMLMFRDSFMHLLDHYHRDYLLEVLEHQIQGSPNPGLYPDLELAPRQRFASKSGFIVRLDATAEHGLVAVGDRIVP